MITEQDKAQLKQKGISEEKFMHQLDCFKTGFPFLKLAGAASVEKGITVPTEVEEESYLAAWDTYTATTGHKVVKFVPASGAASRMFKNMFAFADGTISLQILESSQIDMDDAEKKAMFEKGTHFNPVDLVCAIKDHNGKPFHLPDYVDPQTGFISHKSKDGKELKALELPGLWNGAMSDWSTVFVEVPLETFNPVKTVNDLYREQHQ